MEKKRSKLVISCIMMVGLTIAIGGFGKVSEAARPVCGGEPSECLETLYSWSYEGEVIDEPSLFDVTILKLSDGRYRLYGELSNDLKAYISSDGLNFQEETATIETNIFMPFTLKLKDGRFRLYYTDQTATTRQFGGRAIKSAISENGLDFTIEDGDRLASSGEGYEASGIKSSKILELDNGSYRMYYNAADANEHWRILSATSQDGLNWTREPGVRLDPSILCPPATRIGNVAPFLGPGNIYHLYVTANKCGANYANEKPGIFNAVSLDGLTFNIGDTLIVKDYFKAASYTGDPADPKVTPQDPAVIMTDNGLRMYFGLYDGGNVIAESGIYSIIMDVINPDITANGSNGTVTIGANDTLSLNASMDIKAGTGPNADWWAVARTPTGGYYHYRYGSGGGSWQPGLSYAYQAPLFDLNPFSLFNGSGLQAGSYTIFFGVDLNTNGTMDLSLFYYDAVSVNIE